MFCACCASDDKGATITEVPTSTDEITNSTGQQFEALIQSVQIKATQVEPADAKENQETHEPREPQEPITGGLNSAAQLSSENQLWNKVDSAGYLLNGMPRAYMVNVRRDGEVLGLELDVVDGVTGMVTRLKDGMAKTWNEQNPTNKIAVGDRIIEVNGTSGLAQDFLDPLRNDSLLSITFERASMRRIDLVKGGRSLGMDILYTACAASLVVKRLTAGVVLDWNKANSGREVREGDRIFRVNGITELSKLLAEIQSVEELHMMCYCYG